MKIKFLQTKVKKQCFKYKEDNIFAQNFFSNIITYRY